MIIEKIVNNERLDQNNQSAQEILIDSDSDDTNGDHGVADKEFESYNNGGKVVFSQVDPRGVEKLPLSSLISADFELDAKKVDDHKHNYPHTARTITETIEENERMNEMQNDTFESNMNLLPRLSSENF